VRELLTRSNKRGRRAWFTSHLAVGEIVAGAAKSTNVPSERIVRETLREMGLTCLPFDEGAVRPFARLRSLEKLKVADAIHLACAASARNWTLFSQQATSNSQGWMFQAFNSWQTSTILVL